MIDDVIKDIQFLTAEHPYLKLVQFGTNAKRADQTAAAFERIIKAFYSLIERDEEITIDDFMEGIADHHSGNAAEANRMYKALIKKYGRLYRRVE